MSNAAFYEVGTKVRGNYFGADFSGTVEYARPHSLSHLLVVHVLLDAPITVYGDERSAIAMHVTDEGVSPDAPSYIKAAQ